MMSGSRPTRGAVFSMVMPERVEVEVEVEVEADAFAKQASAKRVDIRSWGNAFLLPNELNAS